MTLFYRTKNKKIMLRDMDFRHLPDIYLRNY